jgi:hypothetical protein
MIKVTYKTIIEGMQKPEKTTIRIFDNRYMAHYDVKGKAEQVVKKMREDGKKGVLYSRGLLIQNFQGKDEEEILDIVLKDIENGKHVGEEKSKKKIEIKDLVVDR